MGANVWPVNAVSTNPTYQGRALRQTTVATSMAGTTAARPFGAYSGVRPGTPNNIVTATSTTWTVTPFGGVIDGESLNIAGPYAYSFDTNQTGSVTAAAGSARIDRLDVQVSDPAESDGTSTPGIAVVYTAGTAGSGVAAAAPARSHPLALINVPASGGGSPTVSWTATFSVGAGGILPSLTVVLLPAAGNQIGQLAEVFADSTALNNATYRWNGTAWKAWHSDWVTYSPTITNVTAGTGGSATSIFKVRYIEGTVEVKADLVLGTTGGAMGTFPSFSLPVAAEAVAGAGSPSFLAYEANVELFDVSATAMYKGMLIDVGSNVARIGRESAAAATTLYSDNDASNPMVWAAGDAIRIRGFRYSPA